MKRVLAFALSLSLIASFATTSLANDKKLLIATATTGGTYYPVGVGIGTLISLKLAKSDGITATAINSAGSGENISMLSKKEADLAILQSLFGFQAYHGEGFYNGKAVTSFRAITVLWPNVEHFALNKDYVKTGTAADLLGLDARFSIGKRGSGTEGSGRAIIGALGGDAKKMNLEYLGYTPSVQAMLDGRLGGANIPAGAPAAAITQLYAMSRGNAAVLDFTDAELAQVTAKYPIWFRYVIKANTYPGQDKDIKTIAQPNILAARSDLPEETVYKITKTIYENLAFLGGIHSATKQMAIEKAIVGLPVPLHPGAARYYQEQGINIPKRLLP